MSEIKRRPLPEYETPDLRAGLAKLRRITSSDALPAADANRGQQIFGSVRDALNELRDMLDQQDAALLNADGNRISAEALRAKADRIGHCILHVDLAEAKTADVVRQIIEYQMTVANAADVLEPFASEVRAGRTKCDAAIAAATEFVRTKSCYLDTLPMGEPNEENKKAVSAS
tara:strand:- start:446 stop:964 length:519 start_codon:yes stop_codon:yes gene_type:complete